MHTPLKLHVQSYVHGDIMCVKHLWESMNTSCGIEASLRDTVIPSQHWILAYPAIRSGFFCHSSHFEIRTSSAYNAQQAAIPSWTMWFYSNRAGGFNWFNPNLPSGWATCQQGQNLLCFCVFSLGFSEPSDRLFFEKKKTLLPSKSEKKHSGHFKIQPVQPGTESNEQLLKQRFLFDVG